MIGGDAGHQRSVRADSRANPPHKLSAPGGGWGPAATAAAQPPPTAAAAAELHTTPAAYSLPAPGENQQEKGRPDSAEPASSALEAGSRFPNTSFVSDGNTSVSQKSSFFPC